MTEELEQAPAELGPAPRPSACRVKVARQTRGYDLGVVEVPEADAEALVAAGVARYVR